MVLSQRGIWPQGLMARFDQHPAPLGVALFAEGSEPALPAAGFLAGVQPEITRNFLAATKASYGTNRQHEGQRGDRPDARMGHQQNRIIAALGFFQNRAI